MLILKRREGQAIRLDTTNGPIVLTVEEFDLTTGLRPSVKLSFRAPDSVNIMRTELLRDEE